MMGTPANYTRGQTAKQPVKQRKFGLVPMRPESTHMLTIRTAGKPTQLAQVTARPHNTLPEGVKVRCVCLGAGCEGKSWEDTAAMRRDHKPEADMVRLQVIHVWGLWSNEDVNPKVDGCKACSAEKAGPCEAHRGGVYGLIAPEASAPVEGS